METILIVDDDTNLCSVLREELSEVGYDAEYVNTGDDAFSFLVKNSRRRR